MRVRWLVGASMASLLVVACNLLTGASDLEIVDGDASTAPSKDAGSTIDATINLGDGASPIDAAPPPMDAGPPPACPSTGHSCAKAPPAGWDGPFMVYIGTQDAAPACPSEMPDHDDAPMGNPKGDFSCECQCGSVTGAACKAFLDEFDGTACADPQVGREDLSSCHTPGAAGGSFRASVELTKGSCAPAGGFKTKADPTFAAMMRLCHRSTAFLATGCGADELCVPDGATPFKTKLCIANADWTQGCPAGWSDANRVYDGVDDTRACNTGSCACEDPTGQSCVGGRLKNHTQSTTCNGPGPGYNIPLATCVVASPGSSQNLDTPPSVNGGSCAAHGEATAAGSVSGKGGGIVCCAP